MRGAGPGETFLEVPETEIVHASTREVLAEAGFEARSRRKNAVAAGNRAVASLIGFAVGTFRANAGVICSDGSTPKVPTMPLFAPAPPQNAP